MNQFKSLLHRALVAVVFAVMYPFILVKQYAEANLVAWNAPVTPEELKKLEEALVKKSSEVVEAVQKALKDEVAKFETITGKTNERITEVSTEAKKAVESLATAQKELAEFKARMLDVEQRLDRKGGNLGGGDTKSPGKLFVESENYKSADPFRASEIKAVEVGLIHKTALINAQGQNQPLVADQRVPGIVTAANRRLTIRDLLPQMRTESNLIQFATETFTNNAGLQWSSPNDKENVTKQESALSYALSNSAVETIAHWIPVSRQLLADASGLEGYINGRLLYGLKLKEETQLLTGDGSAGNITGLNTGATAYNRGVSNDTMLDCLLKAMLQVALSEFSATAHILNPIDWTQIRLIKDTQGRYLFGNPQDQAEPRLWGIPVVATNSQTSGTFTTGAFDLAAAIWDREDATVRMSEHHDTFFVKNMVAILAEERMALTIYRSTAIIKGTLPALGT